MQQALIEMPQPQNWVYPRLSDEVEGIDEDENDIISILEFERRDSNHEQYNFDYWLNEVPQNRNIHRYYVQDVTSFLEANQNRLIFHNLRVFGKVCFIIVLGLLPLLVEIWHLLPSVTGILDNRIWIHIPSNLNPQTLKRSVVVRLTPAELSLAVRGYIQDLITESKSDVKDSEILNVATQECQDQEVTKVLLNEIPESSINPKKTRIEANNGLLVLPEIKSAVGYVLQENPEKFNPKDWTKRFLETNNNNTDLFGALQTKLESTNETKIKGDVYGHKGAHKHKIFPSLNSQLTLLQNDLDKFHYLLNHKFIRVTPAQNLQNFSNKSKINCLCHISSKVNDKGRNTKFSSKTKTAEIGNYGSELIDRLYKLKSKRRPSNYKTSPFKTSYPFISSRFSKLAPSNDNQDLTQVCLSNPQNKITRAFEKIISSTKSKVIKKNLSTNLKRIPENRIIYDKPILNYNKTHNKKFQHNKINQIGIRIPLHTLGECKSLIEKLYNKITISGKIFQNDAIESLLSNHSKTQHLHVYINPTSFNVTPNFLVALLTSLFVLLRWTFLCLRVASILNLDGLQFRLRNLFRSIWSLNLYYFWSIGAILPLFVIKIHECFNIWSTDELPLYFFIHLQYSILLAIATSITAYELIKTFSIQHNDSLLMCVLKSIEHGSNFFSVLATLSVLFFGAVPKQELISILTTHIGLSLEMVFSILENRNQQFSLGQSGRNLSENLMQNMVGNVIYLSPISETYFKILDKKEVSLIENFFNEEDAFSNADESVFEEYNSESSAYYLSEDIYDSSSILKEDLVNSSEKDFEEAFKQLSLNESVSILPPYRSLCQVCYIQLADTIIYPCLHGVLCEHCLRKFLTGIARAHHPRCPLCRSPIDFCFKCDDFQHGVIKSHLFIILKEKKF